MAESEPDSTSPESGSDDCQNEVIDVKHLLFEALGVNPTQTHVTLTANPIISLQRALASSRDGLGHLWKLYFERVIEKHPDFYQGSVSAMLIIQDPFPGLTKNNRFSTLSSVNFGIVENYAHFMFHGSACKLISFFFAGDHLFDWSDPFYGPIGLVKSLTAQALRHCPLITLKEMEKHHVKSLIKRDDLIGYCEIMEFVFKRLPEHTPMLCVIDKLEVYQSAANEEMLQQVQYALRVLDKITSNPSLKPKIQVLISECAYDGSEGSGKVRRVMIPELMMMGTLPSWLFRNSAEIGQ